MDPAAPFFHLDTLGAWGATKPGTKLPKFKPLFPRVATSEIKSASPDSGRDKVQEPLETKPQIRYESFDKLDFRVATIVKAETIPKSKKLLKLDVDLGEIRTIVSGISESYRPEELVGKQVVVVANLKPTKLMGIQSNGMLLAAGDDKACSIVILDKKTAPGTPVN
jgi:methionyl-tRNA synthetase